MRGSREAFWWSLFAAGGVLTALFVPALVLATGFVLPTEDEALAADRYERLSILLRDGWWRWIVRLVLLGVIALGFFHCAHRIRHTLADLGLRSMPHSLTMICYGGATLGAAAAAWIIVLL